jgi:hypothetical protein
VSGSREFVWPGGTEGISISGSSTVAEHKYLDDNKLVVQVTHRDSRRIVLTGQFSGKTGAANIRELLDVLVAIQPPGGKELSIPGVFMRAQKVAVADYTFDHAEGDSTDSFAYTISFIHLGVGTKIPNVKTVKFSTPLNPKSSTVKIVERGKGQRVFTVRDNARSLRVIADIVYGDSNRWNDIYQKNSRQLWAVAVPAHITPITPLPLGMKLNY